MGACRRSTSSSPRHYLVAALCAAVVVASGCSDSGDDVEAAQERVANAEEAVADAKADLEEAGAAFCAEAKDYIAAIDRYGKAFDDETATVGDIENWVPTWDDPGTARSTPVRQYSRPTTAVNDANEELTEARAELAEAKASASGNSGGKAKPSPTPPPSEPSVPQASVDRVKTAEEDLEAASEGITDQTPLTEATEEFTSAAFALEVAWINLFADAGCLADEEAADARGRRARVTVALQADLKTAGYLEGEVEWRLRSKDSGSGRGSPSRRGSAAHRRGRSSYTHRLGRCPGQHGPVCCCRRTCRGQFDPDGAEARRLLARRDRRGVDARTRRGAQGVPEGPRG